MRDNFGFTLAEVLITLGIIGVVAAMTMPTLIQNQQKRSLEVATKKFYSMMSQAVRQYMADEGVDDLRNSSLCYNYDADTSDDAWYAAQEKTKAFVKKYFKIVKECDRNQNTCFPPIQNFNKSITTDVVCPNNYSFVTADGAAMCIYSTDWSIPIEIRVDVNGKKGPNRNGYDVWSMDIFYDGSIDESTVGPECRQGKGACGLIHSNPYAARQARFYECQGRGDGTFDGLPYGACFGHFLENGFKFDY